jgi:hypothetical protein
MSSGSPNESSAEAASAPLIRLCFGANGENWRADSLAIDVFAMSDMQNLNRFSAMVKSDTIITKPKTKLRWINAL